MSSLLRRTLGDEADAFIKEIKRDTKLKKYLLTILPRLLKEMENVDLSDINWQIKRAYNDGRMFQLKQIITLLTKDDHVRDQ